MHFSEPILQYVQYALLAVTVIAAAIIDLRERRIPNLLTFPAIAAFLALHTIQGGLDGLLFSLAGLGAGFSVLMAAYLMKLMGAGDVKLFAAIGACLGVTPLLTIFLFTSIAGGLHFTLVILYERMKASRRSTPQSQDQAASKAGARMSYGLAIAVGTLGAVGLHLLAGFEYIRFF